MAEIKIGVAITTKNRQEVFNKTILMWNENMDQSEASFYIVVVDDGSDFPVNTRIPHIKGASFKTPIDSFYRFEKSVGIARAKNKCLEMLDELGCTHFFLSDDDFYPTSPDWWKPYVESDQPHLMYIFQDFSTKQKVHDTAIIYNDGKIKAYSHPRGVLLYVTKSVLDRVGGMDPEFGLWGWDHPEWSDRIFNAGLTTFKYMDIPDSNKLFHCMDEHQEVKSTVWGQERVNQIRKNKPLYEAKKGASQYVPYKQSAGNDIILTSYFTGVVDPQTGNNWAFDEKAISGLFDSCAKQITLPNVVMINDCLNPGVWRYDTNEYTMQYIAVDIIAAINPYFQRWVSYRDYLIRNKNNMRYVFCVDATDVEVLNNPFPHMQHGVLYTGDEPDTLKSQWLNYHHKHPRLQAFFKLHFRLPLLNAGLLGGDVDTVIRFCGDMIDEYTAMTADSDLMRMPGPGMTDMGVFNLVARSGKYELVHGRTVNTIFKQYQKTGESWFRHK